MLQLQQAWPPCSRLLYSQAMAAFQINTHVTQLLFEIGYGACVRRVVIPGNESRRQKPCEIFEGQLDTSETTKEQFLKFLMDHHGPFSLDRNE